MTLSEGACVSAEKIYCMIICPHAGSDVAESEGFICNVCCLVQMALSSLRMTQSSRFS